MKNQFVKYRLMKSANKNKKPQEHDPKENVREITKPKKRSFKLELITSRHLHPSQFPEEQHDRNAHVKLEHKQRETRATRNLETQ